MSTQAICERCKAPVETRHDLVVASMGLKNPVAYHARCYTDATEGQSFSFHPTAPLNGPNYALIKQFGIPAMIITLILDIGVLIFFAQYQIGALIALPLILIVPTLLLLAYFRYMVRSVEQFENMFPEESS